MAILYFGMENQPADDYCIVTTDSFFSVLWFKIKDRALVTFTCHGNEFTVGNGFVRRNSFVRCV